MKEKWLFILILILLAACTSPAGTALSDPVLPLLTNQTGWWVDTTSTLSPSTQAELEKLSQKVEISGFQLGGAIFNNSLSEPLDLATQFGNTNQLGSAEKDNGVAIVVILDKAGGSGDKPAIGVAVGSGLEGLLNDAKVGRFLDKTFVPARSAGEWDKGLVEFVSLVQRYLADPESEEFRDPPSQEISGWTLLGYLLLLILVLFLLAWLGGGETGDTSGSSSWSSSSSSGGSGGGGGFSGGGGSR
ncbi:hypothetical protein COY32_03480 [candidate division WWE3 bacterium CG_4_10_14_0_2_um_filter_41_14]|uniref:TPM domain-containing protein n=1 Tax=candidate division WWE3 bacterium CG_4_10_14_0_2_um_filter_41_14 TaxID=1975072 RepID=A0A2M7TIV5_UNCKA|nr:MAG: hypothetical protein COY32_03480 [candidate division WWE3 bacterium CG_4_10_14_0_2_um_filter_41_14]